MRPWSNHNHTSRFESFDSADPSFTGTTIPQGLSLSTQPTHPLPDTSFTGHLLYRTPPFSRNWFFWLNGHYRSGLVCPGNTTVAAESSTFLIAHFKFITVLLCCMTRSYAGWLFKILCMRPYRYEHIRRRTSAGICIGVFIPVVASPITSQTTSPISLHSTTTIL